MTNKELVTEAAKYMGLEIHPDLQSGDDGAWTLTGYFNPLTNKSDLWDLAERAKLMIDFEAGQVLYSYDKCENFTVGNHESCPEIFRH